MIIRTRVYPRAGLVGNPSDGYYGKTIAFVFRNFHAEVVLYESPELEILPNERDHSVFSGVRGLVEDVRSFGYYGGIRLLKATVKRFYEYAAANRIPLDDRNFSIRYSTNIPHHVGLAGSSAIITACLRALLAFYRASIPNPLLANLALSVEKEELGISAGLQDRVVQACEGLVYMDFNKAIMERQGYGHYEALSPRLLPPLYIAYRTDLAEGSEVFHGNLRHRFEQGEKAVVNAMRYWARLTDRVRGALLRGDKEAVGPLLDANFDRRRRLYRISEGNLRMVELARSAGASAKFTGSGGAIVGVYRDEKMYARLKKTLRREGIRVFKPVVTAPPRKDKS
ncbi:MAG: GHMP kinase [Planctomycetota bacterium]